MVSKRNGGPIDTIVDLPFIQFIEKVLEDLPSYVTNFFNGYTNRCRVIGKQENLREDLNLILSMLKIPYNKDYLYSRETDNVTNPTAKYPYSLALEVMKAERDTVLRYNYNYIPEEIISV